MGFLMTILGGAGEGVLWGIMAFGVYITYRLLDVADLTVEGSFATGSAIVALLINNNCDPLLASLVALLIGGVAGMVTGLLITKFKIAPILAGILTMTALYSVNLIIMGMPTLSLPIGVNMFAIVSAWFNDAVARNLIILIIGLIVSAIIIGASYWFFGTEVGSAIRATGSNEKMCRAQGINTDNTKIIGLMISNALVAFSGSLVAQQFGYGDISFGVGSIVIGLASVIIGEAIISAKHNFLLRIISVFVGSIIYREIITLIIFAGLPTDYIKLLTAALVVIALSLPNIKGKFKRSSKSNNSKRVKEAVGNPTDVIMNDEVANQIVENAEKEGSENA